MRWEEILKLIIPVAIAISASLVGGDKIANAKIAKHDDAIVEMQKEIYKLGLDIEKLEWIIKHEEE